MDDTPDLFAEPEPPKLRSKVAEQGNAAEYLLRRLHKIAKNEKLPGERRLAAVRAIEGYRTGRLTSVRAAGTGRFATSDPIHANSMNWSDTPDLFAEPPKRRKKVT